VLIKRTYEAIRNSPLWEQSMLIITWDECGGFYDHVAPPATVPPGDPQADDVENKHRFAFDQLGPRVPAVVISPLIPKNLVDHRVYDHASVLATIERAFGLAPLTGRDQHANSLTTLVSLAQPRQDTPAQLEVPADYELPPELHVDHDPAALAGPVDDEALPGFLFSAVVQDFELRDPSEYPAIQAQLAAIQTRREAAIYMDDVAARMVATRAATS
jgi:phospholipase C